MHYLIVLALIHLFSGCATWTPVSKCLDTVDRETGERTEYSLCKKLRIWE